MTRQGVDAGDRYAASVNRASGVHRVEAHQHDAAGVRTFEPIDHELYVPQVPHVASLIHASVVLRRDEDFGGLRVEVERVSSGPEGPETIASAPLEDPMELGDGGYHFAVEFRDVVLAEEGEYRVAVAGREMPRVKTLFVVAL